MYKYLVEKKFKQTINFEGTREENFFYKVFHESKNKFFKVSLGKKNSNKIFLIIKRSPGGGFFSNLIYVIKYLDYAFKQKYIPIIDMENFPTKYNQKNNINNIKNIWELYFNKVSNYKLKDVYQSKNVIFSKDKFDVHLDDYKNLKLKQIFLKKIKINKKIINDSLSFFKKNLNDDSIGIHLRGTDQKITPGHHLPPTIYEIQILIEKRIKKNSNTKFFLVTEEKKYYDILKKKYKKFIFAYPSFRANNIKDFNYSLRKNHRNKLGIESLIESLILSYCKELIFCNSNIPLFSIFVSKKKIKRTLINHGVNSANPIIASIKWYLKVLPVTFVKYLVYRILK